MKTLVKFAMGAAIAGALVNMLLKQRSGKSSTAASSASDTIDDTSSVGDTNTVGDTNSVGETGDQRGPQPQDWRGAQNVLDS